MPEALPATPSANNHQATVTGARCRIAPTTTAAAASQPQATCQAVCITPPSGTIRKPATAVAAMTNWVRNNRLAIDSSSLGWRGLGVEQSWDAAILQWCGNPLVPRSMRSAGGCAKHGYPGADRLRTHQVRSGAAIRAARSGVRGSRGRGCGAARSPVPVADRTGAAEDREVTGVSALIGRGTADRTDVRDRVSAMAKVAGIRPRTAVELARELDDLENSQGHDIEAIFARATRIEQDAAELAETVLVYRARLVQADMARRRGDVGGAARTFAEIHRWAELNESRPLRARCHFHLALTYHYLGDLAASLEHAISSVELMEESTPRGLQVIYLIRLANSLAETGAVDAARERYRQAERLAVAIGDLTRQMLVLNNLAYTEYEAGALEEAAAVAARMHAVVAELGRDFLITERDTIANIQISRGQYAAAEETVRAAVNAPQWFEMHDLADAALTLAEAQRRLGTLDRAQASLDRCRQLCDERELVGVRVRVYAEQAELYAANGDYRNAFEEYKRFHAAAERLRSRQQEARALARQAMFETAEAKQDAERYRE